VYEGLKRWLRDKLIPDVLPVSREEYLKAWGAVVASEEGRTVVAYLRYSLWQTAAEEGPLTGTSEQRALWLANHDARKRVLADLVKDATQNRELVWVKRESLTPIKSRTTSA
jgi:hypothetical protein